MATRKAITDQDVWDALSRYLFPAGIPPAEGWPAETRFIGGYPTAYIDPMTVEWDHDFSPREEQAWQRLIRRLRRQVEVDDVQEEAMGPYIAVLRQWRGRDPAKTTDAHRDAVLDAMVDLWRLTLKEDDE